jgi:cysteinyl-tRNA synthetase
MDDDLNVSSALASLFDFVGKISPPLAQGRLAEQDRDKVLDVLKGIDSVFGILNFYEENVSQEVEHLLAERARLRKAGQWVEADAVRRRLAELGIEISDTPDGTIWRLK